MVSTGITDVGKQKLLNNLVSGSTYLGLASSVPQSGATPTLANISEIATAGYTREAVTWGSAVFPGPPVYIANSADTTFGPMTADMALPANYAFLTDSATGSAINAPSSLVAGVTGTSGSWGTSTGTKYWVVTATNSQGETTISNEVTATIAAANTSVPLAWTAVSGATGYNVYRGLTPGGENVLVASVSTNSYTDVGAVGTVGTPPTINTAPAGNIWYVWALATPAQVPTGKPVLVPANSLVIQ